MSPLAVAAGALGLACVLAGLAAAALDHHEVRRRLGLRPSSSGAPARRRPGERELVRLAPFLGLLLGWVAAALPGAAVGIAAGVAGPRAWARKQAAARAALLEDQLAEAALSLAAGMRAGLSLSRSVRFASEEGEEPLASTFRSVADRTDLGVPLERSLEVWAREMGSPDARLLAGVLDLHRRTGGELPAVLDRVATTLRERRAAAREIRALTAQARLSGAILGLLPIGFFLFLSVTSRADIEAAFHTQAGIAAVALGLTMQGLAFLWIRKLLQVGA
jgi:tight adherence protein B